jgi:hypothetical protein
MAGFNEFNQDAGRAGWVQKDIAMAACADFDFVGDEARAAGFQFLDNRVQIGNANRNMVQAFATVGDELCDY